MRQTFVFCLFILLFLPPVFSQDLQSISVNNQNRIISINGIDSDVPLASFRIGIGDDMFQFYSDNFPTDQIGFSWKETDQKEAGVTGEITIQNISADTLRIDNLVPFGMDSSHLYITGRGDHRLSRTHLFRPGYKPVNVIVPDNAWELGYASFKLNNGEGVTGLLRRKDWSEGSRKRFETILYPGGSVTYSAWFDLFNGDWQEGLRKMFQEKYLHDVESFDNTLFEREDLQWIRQSYAMHLVMAWDQGAFYNRARGEYVVDAFLERGQKWYGGDDVFGIWPTWPTLGLDQRNQWDLFRDLPGGMEQLRSIADLCRDNHTKFFISYNPWDASTRNEDHLEGMADLIRGTSADGVVLDTQGSSSTELQDTADGVKEGVVMYSEGMAVPEDMQGIVSGRVHNALYYPPLLNLNKFIKPDFAIFRVAELQFERIRREYSLSMFNGYGTELNIFRPGRPEWIEEDYRYFGRTLRVLRENTSNFTHDEYTPLINTKVDGIYVNKWPREGKIIYTLFNLHPEGYTGPLFQVESEEGYHFIDLWNHQELETVELEEENYLNVQLDGFSEHWLGTNNEGSVGAVVQFPELLMVEWEDLGILNIVASGGKEIKVWAGHPAYNKEPLILEVSERKLDLQEAFGRYRGDYVIQLFENGEILDERIVTIAPGTPLLISKSEQTSTVRKVPRGMVEIPAGVFEMKVSSGDEFIAYPKASERKIRMNRFFMDKHPVTNAEFLEFLKDSRYQPADSVNFLKMWPKGEMPDSLANYPVVYISLEDAKEYARWAGKRLPTEVEWQYAAQTEELLTWPWGADELKREEQYVTNTLTVSKIKGIDSTYCNPGNGKMDPVGKYPKGANPHGLEDLVGSVWQLTNDVYQDDSYEFVLLKGGSYFHPGSSWWYVQGGPRELTWRQHLLRVSPGFERKATVGFRCVKDAEK